MTSEKPNLEDGNYSAKSCGCDPYANHLCKEHKQDVQCVIGHWTHRDSCPACRVLLKEISR